MKRGVSTVMGVILLIGVVLVIFIAVFLISRLVFSQLGKEAEAEKTCSELKFEIADFCRQTLNIENVETGVSKLETRIKFNGRNNLENSVLIGFLFSLDYGGEIIPYLTLEHNEVEGGEAKTLFTDYIGNPDDIKQIIVSPRIKINNKIVTCDKRKEVVDWMEIEPC